ncbi:hypothetical protein KP509_25G014000 [Ceratopteris richardii]|uniref:Uncharacterized protein n=1 Tax=Ceratopteris richardii TaxID=49495 RepID=A0A8T2RP89_CERRI|nr:hypothetical protein KP509_25G014000 [Ceratopteris richardii]
MGVLTGIPTYNHDPPIQMNLNSRVILYDGASRLSNAGVHWLIKNDKERTLSFCPVQSEAATPYLQLCGLTKEDAEHRFLFVEGPGQISEASTAALRVINYLPFPYQIMTIFLAVPEPLRDVVYNYIPRRRCECVGQSDSYILPRKDVVDRFINSSEIRDRYSQETTL